jgi:hypothetical protein
MRNGAGIAENLVLDGFVGVWAGNGGEGLRGWNETRCDDRTECSASGGEVKGCEQRTAANRKKKSGGNAAGKAKLDLAHGLRAKRYAVAVNSQSVYNDIRAMETEANRLNAANEQQLSEDAKLRQGVQYCADTQLCAASGEQQLQGWTSSNRSEISDGLSPRSVADKHD